MLTIVLIPSVTLLIVGTCLSGFLVNEGIRAQRSANDVRNTLAPTTRFVVGAQKERRLTMLWLNNPGQSRAELDDQRRQVDAALADMSVMDQRLADGAPANLRASLEGFQQAARELPDMRRRVDQNQATAQNVYTWYDDLLSQRGENIQAMARSAGDTEVGFQQMISYNLFRSAEAMSRAHAMAARAVLGGLDAEQFHELAHQLGMYHEQIETLLPSMTQQERSRYAALKTTPAWKQLVAGDNFLMNRGPSPTGPEAVPFNVPEWENAAQQVSVGLMGLYDSHSDYAADLGSASARQTLLISAASAAAVLLGAVTALLIALRLSRRLIRRLTRLREETLDLAHRELPDVVRRLGAGERIDVETQVPWLDHGKDEIGQLASAFNAAQRSAISATVRETETRQGVRKVFLNIAHRSQVIVHRQLRLLDETERSLEDPDQLHVLFQLDHLATRGRRNAENLIILGDGKAGRQWRNPVSLGDVVRSAIAETEHYTRVDTVRLPDTPIAGSAVADLIHLLAELVDNATSFSPPQARVEVRGNVVGRGVVVELEDQGLGIEPEQLSEINEMLHDPPDFGVMALSTEPRVGLFVVARLAARHGIKVTLRDSVYDGIRATVLIPSELIAMSGGSEDTESAGSAESNALPAPRNAASQAATSSRDEPARELPLDQTADDVPANGHPVSRNESTPAQDTNGSAPARDSTVSKSASPSKSNQPSQSTLASSTNGDLPPLPRRNRQANLAVQLQDDRSSAEEGATGDPVPLRTPERSRSTLAAFQRGTRRARTSDQDTESE